ncbi:hypothetical protein KSB_22410 [Ktedonobacter robiniae]|uniref:Uncharacterized protein n=1 Tax=Ktedonobacter robiniae TaxID=2778365 RepID=A0ABQ3ULZ1_9CHLR|nr:hypothetical protein KSB_22410 [Ktedonobacter robiniae]
MKSGENMKQRAAEHGIRRLIDGRSCRSIIHRSMCYADWANTAKALNIEPESEEGYKLLKQLNHYAITTEHKGLSFWWLLPVMEMSNVEESLSPHVLKT